MTDAEDSAYVDVEGALLADPDADVRSGPGGLTVGDRLFAFRAPGGGLVVDLPQARADDLAARDVAEPFETAPVAARGAWVVVRDLEDWPELADEAHRFVGEPAVGRDS